MIALPPHINKYYLNLYNIFTC